MADPIITKIGDVSAYLDAVAHGFEGTRAEFGELLANSANYAQSAESAASAAVASAATATTKAGEATTAATAAQTAKTQTEAAASQALMDIGTAESGAISAIQTEGATQTANATAQAQAAATSATTASTKASEASASATTATTKATEAAASATSAANSASAAQGVLDSIPEDYSDLSEYVDQLKAELDDNQQELGFAVKNFSKIAGSNHSSTADKLDIAIKSGQKFYVTVSQTGSESEFYYQLFGWHNGVSTKILNTPKTSVNKIEITASSDYEQLSVYVGNDLYAGTAEMTLLFEQENSKLTAIETLKGIIYNGDIEWVDGYGVLYRSGATPANQYRSYTEIDVGIFEGGRLTGHTNDADGWGGAFYDVNGNYVNGFGNPVTGRYSFDIDVEIPSSAVTVKISCLTDHKSEFWLSYPFDRYTPNMQALWSDMGVVKNDIDNLDKKSEEVSIPLLRNGSVANSANANAVTSHYVLPIYKKYDKIYVEFIGDFSLANQYGLAYCLFRGASDGDTTTEAILDSSVTKKHVNSNYEIGPFYPSPRIPIEMKDISDYDYISVCMVRKLNGTFVPIRIATDQYSIKVSHEYNPDIPVRDIDTDDVSHKSDNARHIKDNSGTPLTLLHFSDLHSDKSALARIMADAEKYSLDGKICTGDMVANTYEQITSWWDASVMTCIGNHDSASYDSSTGYNWTALSMADRDTYYITPFESNWGVTHTTGKSYYYKDYSAQKLRLIVMDVMLYSDNGADATEQTTWLADLLADAITNNLHVVIAIHAPHGGAVPVECSFTRYGQGTMPTYSDCNTPQVVIDTVATAIESGMHFIGYLLGHTHQDNIWDAESNKKQLMYGVTCAHVSNVNQWKNSDQNRSVTEDAYNIVTIDTTNTLVKIVRGGGADIDDHMRTRKAICIDYSTGNVVGEVL